LLPALPDAWKSGSVKGLCARGGFEVSMIWNNHILTKVSVYSKRGGKTTLISGNIRHEVALKAGENREIISD
jgi:alpha-L-fucosidase 2